MRHLGFRYKLMFGFSLLIIAVGGVISAGLNYYFTNTYRQRVRQYMEDVSRQTAINFDTNIQKIEKMTQNVLSNTVIQKELKAIDQKGISAYEDNLISKRIKKELSDQILFEEGISSLSVTSMNGRRVQVTKAIGETDTAVFSNELIKEANGSILWKAAGDGSGKIIAARLVLDLERMVPIGYIHVICEAGYFGTFIQNVSSLYSTRAYIIDEDGHIICSNVSDSMEVPEAVLICGRPVVSIGEQDYYLNTGSAMGNGWKMVTLVSSSFIEGELGDIRIAVLAIAGCCIAAGIGMIVLLTGKMTRPLKELSESMEAIEAADFSRRVAVRSHDELGRLGLQYNHMAESIEKLIDEVYRMGISQKQAEIELLKMQINPHFLYNTLDTVNWMARMGRQDEIIGVTTALAQLLRAAIKQGHFVTVAEEMISVKNYLYIQHYRFGDKIAVSYQIEEAIHDYIIPNFILQPLVENAIIHGLEPKVEPGMLSITGRLSDKSQRSVYFAVCDDGIGMDKAVVDKIYADCEEKSYKSHIGVKNVFLRLKNYYGDHIEFYINSEKNKGTAVEFYIPVELLNKQEGLYEKY